MRAPFGAFLLSLIVAAAGGQSMGSVPPAPEQGGAADLHWTRTRIRVELSTSLLADSNSVKPESDVAGAIRRSFAVWSEATGVEFDVQWSDRVSVSPAGKSGDGVSLVTIAPTAENLLALGRTEPDTAARTRVFFGRRGEISEADIVLNPIQQFSTDGSFGTFDLESTLTHEIGHLLGLGHIPVAGATMHWLQVRNGVFGVEAISKRTLSESDLSAFRSAYAPESAGAVTGRLTIGGARTANGIVVWAEERESGRVVAGRQNGSAGDYRLGGLRRGSYRIFAQSTDDSSGNWISEEIGAVSVSAGREVRLDRKVRASTVGPQIREIGFNGQFADSVIPLNRGAAFVIYMSGPGRTEEPARLYSTSVWMGFADAPNVDFLGGFSIVATRLGIDADAAGGEYTIVAEGRGGVRKYFTGAVTLDAQSNPWSVFDTQ